MPTPRVDVERASGILAEAAIHGDALAAKRAGVSTQTVYRYRKRQAVDPRLSELVEKKKQLLVEQWEPGAIRYMVKLQAKLEELLDEATIENLRDLAGSMKITGELLVAHGVLGGKQSGTDRESPAPEAPPSGIRSTPYH